MNGVTTNLPIADLVSQLADHNLGDNLLIQVAVQANDAKALRTALDRIDSIDWELIRDQDGRSILAGPIANKNNRCIDMLLEAGSNCTFTIFTDKWYEDQVSEYCFGANSKSATPLLYAVAHDNMWAFEKILSYDPGIVFYGATTAPSALMLAIWLGRSKMVKRLLDPDVGSKAHTLCRNHTAFGLLSNSRGTKEDLESIARTLREAGERPSLVDVVSACKNGRAEAMRIIVHMLDKEIPGDWYDPIRVSAVQGPKWSADVCRELTEMGVDFFGMGIENRQMFRALFENSKGASEEERKKSFEVLEYLRAMNNEYFDRAFTAALSDLESSGSLDDRGLVEKYQCWFLNTIKRRSSQLDEAGHELGI